MFHACCCSRPTTLELQGALCGSHDRRAGLDPAELRSSSTRTDTARSTQRQAERPEQKKRVTIGYWRRAVTFGEPKDDAAVDRVLVQDFEILVRVGRI